MYGASLLFSFYCIIVKNYDTSTWILPFTLWVPFNTERLLWWYLLLFIQFSMGMAYSMSQVTITAYFVCCCNYITAICEHFNFLMKSIRADVEFNLIESNLFLYQKRCREIEGKLASAVDVHKKSYEWVTHDACINIIFSRTNYFFSIFNTVTDVNTGVIFALLPGNTLLLGLTMFNVEHVNTYVYWSFFWMYIFQPSFFISIILVLLFSIYLFGYFNIFLKTTFEVVMFVWHIISIACALVWPTLFCYSASGVIENVTNIGNIAYDSNWYDYPPTLQKHIIIIIARSQEDIIFSGLNLIGCSIEVFGNVSQMNIEFWMCKKKVLNITFLLIQLFRSSCSYYLAFRAVSDI